MMNEEVTQQIVDQPLFVCNTVIDIHSQEEATKAAMAKRIRSANLILYGFTGLLGVYLVINSILNQSWQKNSFMFVMLALVLALVTYSQKTSPKKAMQRWEIDIRRRYGSSALHLTTEFFEYSLAQSLEEDEEQFVCAGYSSLFELKETENLFLLRHGRDQYYFISKKGFIVGSADEFRTFMQKRIGGQ